MSRPNRPLVVRCDHDNHSRRIAFPSASTCRLESLSARVGETFNLSALDFFFSYTDDDGEDFPIRSDADLTEAILYFVSGDDGDDASVGEKEVAGAATGGSGGPTGGKIQVRLTVVVAYDGPSLSDTSSLRSFRTGDGSGSGSGSGSDEASAWGSSYYTQSYRSSVSGLSSRPREVYEYEESGLSSASGGGREREYDGHRAHRTPHEHHTQRTLRLERPDDDDLTEYAGSGARPPHELDRTLSGLSFDDSQEPATSTSTPTPTPLPLTGPDSAPAPSLLTHSELGSRWLREQTTLARRKLGSRPGLSGLNPNPPRSRRYSDDDDSVDSEERELGDIALVKDERGRYYYSYESESSHAHAHPADSSITHLPLRPDIPVPGLAIDPGAPPLLAPDCSACGLRLEYMRYVCTTCGAGDLWKADASKPPFVPSSQLSPSESDASDESDTTEWAQPGQGNGQRSGDGDGDGDEGQGFRHRSSSMSTRASREAVNGRGALLSGGTDEHDDAALGRGYELCPSCIETHGIAHAKAAAKADKTARTQDGTRRRRSEMRHAFREMIWGPEGWSDIEYSEDAECTICRSYLVDNRFKCVSCSKFDLCRACYYKVGDIHPAHAFLSLPDKELPVEPTSQPLVHALSNGHGVVAPLQRHPGAFCHNCLQDIYGPRFHCAVCPSWDLCIQCESLPTTAEGGHTSDHIMMKIPVPLASSEVEAVSRRARSRWIEQDSSTVAAATSIFTHSRSPSPTNETVYAGVGGSNRPSTSPTSMTGNPFASTSSVALSTPRAAALDHGIPCSSCGQGIKGRRYECANCPTSPLAYNLCSPCDVRSYRVHDPSHVFLKFDRPVDYPIPPSTAPLLPLLTRNRAGDVPPNVTLPPRTQNPTAYLSHVLHRETLCDVHSDQIRGVWLRCVHCEGGFDTCTEGEVVAGHDQTHVFIAFKARVDMSMFRQLAGLTEDRPRPLVSHRFYRS